MGENRPTAMRGDGMEDVIFAGARRGRPGTSPRCMSRSTMPSASRPPGSTTPIISTSCAGSPATPAAPTSSTARTCARATCRCCSPTPPPGAHSPALVRQGQIAELINAKPKNRRRVLEDAAGIAGLYQRRHEAELKLRGAEQNLARIDDVLEQLAGQIASLARQAKQAARYRAIGAELRGRKGLLLWLRWRDADATRLAAEEVLRAALSGAAQAERDALAAAEAREMAEAALPPLREEEAIAAAVLQRLYVERDSIDAEATAPPRRSHRSRRGSRSFPATSSGRPRSTPMRARPSRPWKPRPRRCDRRWRGTARRWRKPRGRRQSPPMMCWVSAKVRWLGRSSYRPISPRAISPPTAASPRRARPAPATRPRRKRPAIAARDGVERLAALSRDVEAAGSRPAGGDRSRRPRRGQTWPRPRPPASEAESQEAETRKARADAEGRAATLTSEVTSLTRLLERERGPQKAIVEDVGQGRLRGRPGCRARRRPERAEGGEGRRKRLVRRCPGYDEAAPLPDGQHAAGVGRDGARCAGATACRRSDWSRPPTARACRRELLPGQRSSAARAISGAGTGSPWGRPMRCPAPRVVLNRRTACRPDRRGGGGGRAGDRRAGRA
jgi:chromosome segregation protein